MTDSAERKALLKSLHLCVDCKAQDAYTLGGRSRCYDCAMKDAERKRKWRADHADQNRNVVRQTERKRAEAGLCIRCGKPKPAKGNRICKTCNIKMSQKRREREIQRGMNWPRGANGYCWKCNKAPAMDGKKLCEVCRAAGLAALARGREDVRELSGANAAESDITAGKCQLGIISDIQAREAGKNRLLYAWRQAGNLLGGKADGGCAAAIF